MTLHEDRSGFNQMLLDLCFCMRLQDDTAGCEAGGGFNQMFLEPCFSVTLHDERGGFQSNAPGAMLFCHAA